MTNSELKSSIAAYADYLASKEVEFFIVALPVELKDKGNAVFAHTPNASVLLAATMDKSNEFLGVISDAARLFADSNDVHGNMDLYMN